MTKYTDQERVNIALNEYRYYRIGEEVLINDTTKSIGYVSDFKDKATGEQTYVVTDKRLGENPSIMELASVKKVTLLYRGSTSPMQILNNPVDFFVDWMVNDLPMAKKIIGFDLNKTPSPQLQSSAVTLRETLKKYPNAKIDMYGHSLASMNVQHAVASIDEKDIPRINGVYAYNGPNTYITLSPKQRYIVKLLNNKIYNYVDEKDFIGLGYNNEDAVGQVFKIKDFDVPGVGDQHMFGGYLFDKYGNMINIKGEIINQETAVKTLDINADGIDDITVDNVDLSTINFFTGERVSQVVGEKIQVSPIVLRTLSKNIYKSVINDLGMIIKICQLCIEKNDKVGFDFSKRKKQVSENIKETFRETRVPNILDALGNSVGNVIKNRYVFEQLGRYGELDLSRFSSNERPLVNGRDLNPIVYNQGLAILRRSSEPLKQQCESEKTDDISSYFFGRETILKSWNNIEQVTKKLLEESYRLFEGEGLRTGKEDGISQALNQVLKVAIKNVAELELLLKNTIELMEGLANNFEEQDKWLGSKLQNGSYIGSNFVNSMPSSYKAYLERDGIFDDVKSVLQAFDRQVEKNSEEYSKKVVEYYGVALKDFQTGLEKWINHIKDFEKEKRNVEDTYEISVYVEKEIPNPYYEEGQPKTKLETEYSCKIRELYPNYIIYGLKDAEKITSQTEGIKETIQNAEIAKRNISKLHQYIKKITEEGVYKAFDLDEIVDGQNTVTQLIYKIQKELIYVKTNMATDRMSGLAITALNGKLDEVNTSLEYFGSFINDCFGNQS